MKSVKHKLLTILDNIDSIENYTGFEKCNFHEMCEVIKYAIEKITSASVHKLLGVDNVVDLFNGIYSQNCYYDIHEMYGAFYRTVKKCPDTAEKFSQVEFFKNLDECQSINRGERNADTGLKYDGGKLKAGILEDFPLALKAIAEVGTFGAKKYARSSWQNIDNAVERYTDAMWRHRLSEGVDTESGLPHYYHELWNMMVIVELKEREKQS